MIKSIPDGSNKPCNFVWTEKVKKSVFGPLTICKLVLGCTAAWMSILCYPWRFDNGLIVVLKVYLVIKPCYNLLKIKHNINIIQENHGYLICSDIVFIVVCFQYIFFWVHYYMQVFLLLISSNKSEYFRILEQREFQNAI